jgi:cardiolipin synthase (CMP-forming)
MADKLLLMSSFVTLTWLKVLPFWIAAVVISRDLILVMGALAIHMAGGRITPRPTRAGKLATFFQVVTIFMGLVLVPAGLKLAIWLAAIFTIASGLQYIVQGMRFLNATHADEHRTPDATTLFR